MRRIISDSLTPSSLAFFVMAAFWSFDSQNWVRVLSTVTFGYG